MIEQVCIRNYKSIKDANVKLGPLNVLIGSNGVGKSNFISFFELVNAILNKRLGSYVVKRGGFDRFLYQGQKHSKSMDALIDFANTNAFFFRLKPTIENKAYIDCSGDFFNTRKEQTKNYKNLWKRT